jgi:hypothetical protein
MAVERDMGASQENAAERPGKKAIDEQRAMAADADLMAELDQEASSARH